MYTVRCKYCGNYYESKANRSGVCPDCKTTARSRNNTRYTEKTYERVMLYVHKGQREQLKEYAHSKGMSVNEFVNNAIEFYMQKLETEVEASLPDDVEVIEFDCDGIPF